MEEVLFHKIETYLSGKMPPSEQAAFEAEIASDSGLSALVAQHRNERRAVELLIERDLVAKMDLWENEMNVQAPVMQVVKRNNTARYWAAAAAIALALSAGWWLFKGQSNQAGTIAGSQYELPEKKKKSPESKPKSKTKPSTQAPAPLEPDNSDADIAAITPDEQGMPSDPSPLQPKSPEKGKEKNTLAAPNYPALADAYYNEGDLKPSSSGLSALESEAYNRAIQPFNLGRFDDAVDVLSAALKLQPKSERLKEMLAVAYYQNRNFGQAQRYFRELQASPNKATAERADWGEVLTLLKRMPAQQIALQTALHRISGMPRHKYQSKAKELLGKM